MGLRGLLVGVGIVALVGKVMKDRTLARLGMPPDDMKVNERTGYSNTDADSPNLGEQVDGQGLGGTLAKVASVAGSDGQREDIFSSTSQDSEKASTPGLPDLTRGA